MQIERSKHRACEDMAQFLLPLSPLENLRGPHTDGCGDDTRRRTHERDARDEGNRCTSYYFILQRLVEKKHKAMYVTRAHLVAPTHSQTTNDVEN